MSSRRMERIALVRSVPCAMSASTRVLKSVSASATAVLSTIIAVEQLALEPRARNSKRLPTNAKGEVRLRSVLSTKISGICGISSFTPCLPSMAVSSSELELATVSMSSLNSFPKNEEIMAGGASCPPSLCEFVALMMLAFSKPLWRYTPIKVSTTKVRKRSVSSGVLPGECKMIPVSVLSDQLLCLPLPLIPAKGFSWSKQRNPCLRAILRMSDTSNML